MKIILSVIVFLACNAVLNCYAQTTGNIYTFAGNGTAGYSGDGGLATAAQLNQPTDVFKDAMGNIYIADKNNNRIRFVNTSGIISTIAGTGSAGYSGDGGPAISAELNLPNRVFVDKHGNIYIADETNERIRMINTSGTITTIAGTGVAGSTGDGGLATSAELSDPTGVAVDTFGNIFISEHGDAKIRKINTSGIISTYAGGGTTGFTTDGTVATTVSLCGQHYVSVDDTGNIYITNWSCWHFLKVTPAGLMYNVAGYMSPSFSGDCGPADSADIHFPWGITPDNMGNIYLCPQGNIRVRRVNAVHYISTVAGDGTPGYTGDGGAATSAEVSSSIYGIYADMHGNVYFADQGNNVIRNFTTAPYSDSLTLCIGNFDTLTAVAAGSGTWASSNTLVATINPATGIVTAISPGITIISFNNITCPLLYWVNVNICGDTLTSAFDSLACTLAGTITLHAPAGYSATLWSTGSTAPTIAVSSPGVYYVVDTNTTSPGVVIDTFHVTFTAPDTLFSHTDTSACATAGTITLVAPPGYSSYSWSTGSIASSIAVSSSGLYYVASINTATCIVAIDTFHVTFVADDTSFNHTDTSICALLADFTLSAPSGYSGYVWSTGSTTSSITANSAGTYWVNATIGSCSLYTDTFHVTSVPADTIVHNTDTVACAVAAPVTLQAPTECSSYTWSTGSTSSSVSVTGAGIYWVIGTGTGCTVLTDTFVLGFTPSPVVALANDTTICEGVSITIGSPEPTGALYSWSTGSTDSAITVNAAGDYTLTVSDSGCSSSGNIQVQLMTKPYIMLPADTTICNGDSYSIKLQSDASHYWWSTEANTPDIIISASGTYWVIASNSCGETRDTVTVTFSACLAALPSAFSPNNDGSNDVLYVRGAGISTIDFKVFNRFGQVVFETNDKSIGWDGTFHGQPQPIEVYCYVIKVTLIDGSSRVLKGNVSLLR